MFDTSISFMRSLCAGEIEEEVLFPYPTLDADERETLTRRRCTTLPSGPV